MAEEEAKQQILAEWEARHSPIGFYNLALSYLEAADDLVGRIHGPINERNLQLAFDCPIRHLYGHTWELALKACLFAQGIRPYKLKNDFGHRLLKAWKSVDKDRFAILKLTPETECIASHLGLYHSEKMFAYPTTGVRSYLPLKQIKAESQRFRIKRAEVIDLFARSM